MAFLDPAERDEVMRLCGLKRIAPQDKGGRGAYLASLRAVRQRRYAVSSGDITPGVAAIAAPIFDSSGAIVAVLAVRGPDVRMTPAKMEKMAPQIVNAADQISWNLGFNSDRRQSA